MQRILHLGRKVERPDFTRMDVLIRKLDEMCRESQELRDQLAKEMLRRVWPERRHTVRITPHFPERRMPSLPDDESGSS